MFYIGQDNKAQKASTVYVGVGNKARKVIKAYVGVNDVARLCWSDYVKPALLRSGWRNGTNHKTITKITFMRSYTPTGNEDSSWQAAEGRDGSIMCYRTGNEVIIAGDDAGNITLGSGYALFQQCQALKSIEGLELLDTSLTSSMSNMFSSCDNLTSLDLSSFNTSNVVETTDMFAFCYKLASVNLSSFNTTQITRMDGMFSMCKSLTSLDLSSFNTQNVRYMYNMFYGCSGLTSLDLTNFDTFKVTDMESMFESCSNLTEVLVSLNTWNTPRTSADMFKNCGCNAVTYI